MKIYVNIFIYTYYIYSTRIFDVYIQYISSDTDAADTSDTKIDVDDGDE